MSARLPSTPGTWCSRRSRFFALPLLWLILCSFMTNAQINRFPPTIIPDSLHLDGYRYVLRNASSRAGS